MLQLLGKMQKISAEPGNNARPDSTVISSEITAESYRATESEASEASEASEVSEVSGPITAAKVENAGVSDAGALAIGAAESVESAENFEDGSYMHATSASSSEIGHETLDMCENVSGQSLQAVEQTDGETDDQVIVRETASPSDSSMPVVPGSENELQVGDHDHTDSENTVTEHGSNHPSLSSEGFVKRWVKRVVSWVKRLVGF